MRKKIIFVVPVLAPYAIQRFEKLAKDDDLEITLLVEKASFDHRLGWTVNKVKGCEVEIIESFVKRAEVENIPFGYSIKGIRAIPYRLPFLIAKHRPDVVIVCNATELVFSWPLKFLLRYKVGLIVEDTDHAVRHIGSFHRRLKSAIYQRADFFLPFSADSVVYLKNIGIEKNLYRTSWSIDLRLVNENSLELSKNELVRDHNKGTLVFVTVGQLIPRKGIMMLLEAWRTLPHEIQNGLSLKIIGEGPQRNEIETFISEKNIPNIEMLGHKPYGEVAHYLKSSDVFILPTLEDLFGLVVMEAMACGLPVLTTIYSGARELVKEGENGYVFDAANTAEIRKTILKIVEQRGRLKEMGKKSLGLIRNYSHEIVIDDLKKILRAI